MSDIIKVRKFNELGIAAAKDLLSKIRGDNELHSDDVKTLLLDAGKFYTKEIEIKIYQSFGGLKKSSYICRQ